MTLVAGARLGSYEIVAPIGAGGMGEVYRARDPNLNREVAIKVLPENLGADPAALARFEREAQAVAALSHPNILAIHDFGVAEVSIGGRAVKRAYAVTELLDGESLREKLAGGALPPRKAVEYATQIVHGIAAAHQKGVVHCDLKPENIFITGDGRVKILDFGLAKTVGPAGDGSLLQTQSDIGTSPGTVIGTVGYMSPEQVRGLAVDHRTDIFSFGVVLYEMLSGARAFRGDSNVETMNAILKEDPPDLAVTGSAVPPALDRIVRRCIEKSAAERFHSAHDLGLALETLSAPGSTSSGAAIVAAGRSSTRSVLAPWILLASAVTVTLAAFVAGRHSAEAPVGAAPDYQRLTFRRGPIRSARFAADGKTVVYSARWGNEPFRLYSTSPGSPDSRALAYPIADVASVSSSGELALILDRRPVRGFAAVGTLARASLTGEAAREVLENVQDADWLPDGSGLAVAHYVDGRYRLEFPAGNGLRDERVRQRRARLTRRNARRIRRPPDPGGRPRRVRLRRPRRDDHQDFAGLLERSRGRLGAGRPRALVHLRRSRERTGAVRRPAHGAAALGLAHAGKPPLGGRRRRRQRSALAAERSERDHGARPRRLGGARPLVVRLVDDSAIVERR
jgi:hypothetical protein